MSSKGDTVRPFPSRPADPGGEGSQGHWGPVGDGPRRRQSRITTGFGMRALCACLFAALLAGLAPTAAWASNHRATNAVTATASSTTTSTVTQQNLLTGTEATFDGTTGGWVGLSNATLSPAQTPSTLSTGSLQMTATAATWIGAESPHIQATPGAMYTGEASLYSGASATLQVGVAFYNSSGGLITVVWDRPTNLASSTWTTLPETAALAPSSSMPATVALIVGATNVSSGQNLYIESPVLGGVSGNGSPPVDGPLQTSGNKIIQANGAPVTLQGVNMNGLEFNGSLSSSGITEQGVDEAKAWGANYVRVPLSEAFWLSSNCKYSPSYTSAVQQVVNWITGRGMVALLDLHTNTVGGCQAPQQHNMADAAQSPTFWTQVAQTFGSNPLVAFDLYNEPHGISNAVWLNGGQTTDTETGITYQAAGMQQLYNAVRSTGAQNLVFLGGLNWAATPPTHLVHGHNLVYADHCYTGNPSNVVSLNLSLWTSLAATEPIVVTEFGSGFDNGTYNAAVIAAAQAYGWGWSPWLISQGSYPGYDVATFLSDGTAEPTNMGLPVLLGLSGVD